MRFDPNSRILSALTMPMMEDRGIGLRPPVRHRLTGWEHSAEGSDVLCRREHEGWTHTAFCVVSASGSAVNINSTQGRLVRIAAGGWHRTYYTALPNRDNRRRRGKETQPMARHSRDRALAVVRPDCDVPQMGALMQV